MTVQYCRYVSDVMSDITSHLWSIVYLLIMSWCHLMLWSRNILLTGIITPIRSSGSSIVIHSKSCGYPTWFNTQPSTKPNNLLSSLEWPLSLQCIVALRIAARETILFATSGEIGSMLASSPQILHVALRERCDARVDRTHHHPSHLFVGLEFIMNISQGAT